MLNVEFTLTMLNLVIMITGCPGHRVSAEKPSVKEKAIQNF